MGRQNLNKMAERFKRVLHAERVNELGRRVRFCQRERVITPFRLGMSLLVSCATMRVETLADIQRCFNALFGTTVAYKPFHNQLAKWRFGEFMRELVSVVLSQWTVQVLRADARGAFREFKQIFIQDGSSFAVKEALREHYPGRFKTKGPAAVELHVTMSLLDESVSSVVLTPDTFTERAELPSPQSLKGSLLLADRGYFEVGYLASLDAAGASFVVRGFNSVNPRVVAAYSDDGQSLRGMSGKPLKACRLLKGRMLDLDVEWRAADRDIRVRLTVSWNAGKREYRYLVTNLPRARYTVKQVDQAYRLRWQIELLFKEWKSYANLHAFDTANPGIAEGLIWAAIAAAAMKRYLAHVTQVSTGLAISTRKVAMCAHHVLGEIFCALISRRCGALYLAFDKAVAYLERNARRAHPERDRRTGRLQLGLRIVTSVA